MGPCNNLILVSRKGLTLAGASCALGVPPWKPRNPESLDISWRDQAALAHFRSFAWLSAGSDLLPVSGHVPHSHHPPSIKSASVHLQCPLSSGIFSLSLGQADEEFWISAISALLSCAWQGKFLFNDTRKIQNLHFRSFNSFSSLFFTIYLVDSLSGDMASCLYFIILGILHSSTQTMCSFTLL